MKILSASEIRLADAYTISSEPVASIDLMERAAEACFQWISHHIDKSHSFKIFCGMGNNGGDGLALARIMAHAKYNVTAYCIVYGEKKSADFAANESRLTRFHPGILKQVKSELDFPMIHQKDILIDALFGTGLNKPASGLAATCIRHINESGSTVISIDMPTGLYADIPVNHNDAIVKATYTLSFQVPRLAFMFAENHAYTGEWKILDIGLDEKYISALSSRLVLLDPELAKSFLKPRQKFSHKGLYGHALLVAGSYGKIGAAVLAAKACIRTGTGLLTVHIPRCGYNILQTTVPEAMVQVDTEDHIISSLPDTEKFSAVGIGCGLGTDEKTSRALASLLSSVKVPIVLDADAINILGLKKEMLSILPGNSILTPHPKEFERITRPATDDFVRHNLQLEFARKHKVFVVLKGAYTCIACPDGDVYFNNTGNPGMAKGGSGDALTGIILSLLAQKYTQKEACILGVYLHGLAGDIAAKKMSMASMTASDLIKNLGEAFKEIGGTLS